MHVKIIITKKEYQEILQALEYKSDESYSIHIANIIISAVETGNVEIA